MLDPGGNRIQAFACPPKGTNNPPPAPAPTTPEPTTPTTPAAPPTTPVTQPEPEPGFIKLILCDAKGEVVVVTNTGGLPVSLVDFTLHDENYRDDPASGKWIKNDFSGQLAPGESLRILSGPGAVAGAGEVLFSATPGFVWNNAGDTAFLRHPSQIEQTADCV